MMPFLFQMPIYPESQQLLSETPLPVVCTPGGVGWTRENPSQEPYQEAETHTKNNKPHYMLRLASSGTEFQNIPAEHVIAVRFMPEGAMSSFYSAISAEGSDTLALLQHIDFENPFITEAIPGSIITGTFTVTYSANGNTQETRTFRLLGASLVQDVTYPNTYYNASEDLQRILKKP
ncbi:MAG: hypothetical protein WBM86_28375 [Waterburya sp.]